MEGYGTGDSVVRVFQYWTSRKAEFGSAKSLPEIYRAERLFFENGSFIQTGREACELFNCSKYFKINGLIF